MGGRAASMLAAEGFASDGLLLMAYPLHPAGQLEKLGCEVTLLPTRHPVVDIVPFHLLTLAVAEARGIDPDPIRRAPGSKWAEASGSPYPHA